VIPPSCSRTPITVKIINAAVNTYSSLRTRDRLKHPHGTIRTSKLGAEVLNGLQRRPQFDRDDQLAQTAVTTVKIINAASQHLQSRQDP